MMFWIIIGVQALAIVAIVVVMARKISLARSSDDIEDSPDTQKNPGKPNLDIPEEERWE